MQWLAVAEERRAELALAVATNWQLPGEIVAALKPEAAATALGQLVIDAERIATTLETSWRPEAGSPQEARALDELIQGLPGVLDGLAAVPPPAPGRPASVVAPVEHALDGELRPADIPVTDCRKKGAAALSAIALAAAGIELKSSAPFQEASMVRLAVGAGAERVEAWFNVLLCVPGPGGSRVEAELFSPPRETKERWQALFDGRPGAAVHR